MLAYTSASRNSGINNWEVTKRHIDGDREVQRRFARIRDIAGDDARRRSSAATGPRSAGKSPTNGRTARGSRPASRRRRIDAMLARGARRPARCGGKVCGAGGGGCLFCIGEPDAVPAIREALAGARRPSSSTSAIETEGLRVETRVTA